MILVAFWLALLILFTIFAFYWFYAFYKGAPFYPSSREAIQGIVSEARKTGRFPEVAELGSGDGRVAIALAKAGLKVTAYEINPFFTLITRLKGKLAGVSDRLQVKNTDFLKVDLAGFDVLVAYLYPGIMQKLETKLYKELRPGSLIISNTFGIKNRMPVKKLKSKILIYEVTR